MVAVMLVACTIHQAMVVTICLVAVMYALYHFCALLMQPIDLFTYYFLILDFNARLVVGLTHPCTPVVAWVAAVTWALVVVQDLIIDVSETFSFISFPVISARGNT